MCYIARVLSLLLFAFPILTMRGAEQSGTLLRETFAVKTNLLYDAGAVPTLGVEFPVTRSCRWSFDISGSYNPIRMTGSKFWKCWMVQPEIRYNFGHESGKSRGITYFWGTHLLGGEYNLQRTPWLRNIWSRLYDERAEGWGIGAGTGIGVRFNISRHFAFEVEAAAGYIYTRYDRYRAGICGERIGKGTRHYVGPTKLAVNFMFRLATPVRKRPVIPDDLHVIRDTVERERVVTDTMIVRDTVPGPQVLIPPVVRHARMDLRLDFKVNGSEIDSRLGDNSERLDSLCSFIGRYRDDATLRVQAINVEGYSSVDGPASYNKSLSQRRAEAVARYIADQYPQLASMITARGNGEDWESLRFPGKEQLMNINNPDARERKLAGMEGGDLYRSLMREQIPSTRRVEVTIDYTVIDNAINH